MNNKIFSPSKAFVGLLIGILIGFLFNLHYSNSIDTTEMSREEFKEHEAQVRTVLVVLVTGFGTVGFFVRGFTRTREKFSFAASTLGVFAGYLICFIVWSILRGVLGESGEGSLIYYLYYLFMAGGGIALGFLAGGKIPQFYNGEKKIERYGDSWRM